MTLNQLKLNQTAEIIKIDMDDKTKRRLCSMGIMEKSIVQVLRFSPFNDPIEILVKGCCISIRKEVAKKIMVALNEQ